MTGKMTVLDALGHAGGARAVNDVHRVAVRQADLDLGCLASIGPIIGTGPPSLGRAGDEVAVGAHLAQGWTHLLDRGQGGGIRKQQRGVAVIDGQAQRVAGHHHVERNHHAPGFDHAPDQLKHGDRAVHHQTDLVTTRETAGEQGIGNHVGAPMKIGPAQPAVTTHHSGFAAVECGIDPNQVGVEELWLVQKHGGTFGWHTSLWVCWVV